jgi:hypothetical protein
VGGEPPELLGSQQSAVGSLQSMLACRRVADMDERDDLLADDGGIDVQFSDVSYSVSVWTPGRILGPGIETMMMMIDTINYKHL